MSSQKGLTGPALMLAALLVATQFAIARLLPGLERPGQASFASAGALMLLLALPMLLVLRAVGRGAQQAATGPLLAGMALTGLAMRVLFFGAPPLLEDDHYRYLLDGAMSASGLDPYRFSPAELLAAKTLPPALEAVVMPGRAAIAQINFPDLRTIYPGTAQALFALAHGLAPWRLDGLRLVMLLCECATLVMLVLVLRRAGRSPVWAALYWCNPLMAFTLTGQAHVDAALPPFLLGALMAASARRPGLAGALLGLAAGLKLWPVLLVPLLWRAGSGGVAQAVRLAVAAGLGVVLTCGPLLYSALTAGSGLVAYAGGWSVNNAPYAWMLSALSAVFPVETSARLLRAGLAIGAGILALALARHPLRDTDDALGRMLMLCAGVFYLSPAQFPWYGAWFMALAGAAASLPLALAAASLPVYYLFFPLAEAGLRDLHSHGLAALHVLPVIGWWAWRKRNAPRGSTA